MMLRIEGNKIRQSEMDFVENKRSILTRKRGIKKAFVDEKESSVIIGSEHSQDVLIDYLKSSSVHGIQYLGKISVRVGIIGRFVWMCTMIAGVVCSSLMVYQFWHRYNNNPTHTYVDSFFAPIPLVEFPSVTICPFLPSTYKRRRDIAKILKPPPNMTIDELRFIIRHIHELAVATVSAQERFLSLKQQFDNILKTNAWELGALLEFSVSCEDIFKECWYNGRKIKCSEHFRISHSTNGICCSFNYILEDQIAGRMDVKPIYADTYGMQSGLKVVINEEILASDNMTHEMSRVMTNSDGALVAVHNPTSYPGDVIPSRILQADNELQIQVLPTLYQQPAGFRHTTEEGDNVPLCIDEDKNEIEYIPTYLYSNCYTSCKVRLMMKRCGCLAFNYDPITKGSKDLHTCTLSDYTCLKENVNKFRIVQDIRTPDFKCVCRQPCRNVVYETKMSRLKMEKPALRAASAYKGVSSGDAVLRVFMASQYLTVYNTIPATSEISLLASLGGVFSLFLGCSFLSAVEILHFGVLFYRSLAPHFNRARNKKPPAAMAPRNFHDDIKVFP